MVNTNSKALKLLSLVLILALVITGVGFSPVTTKDTFADNSSLPFTDVAENYWGLPGISFCYDKGYMTGTTATTFDPKGTFSRAMAIVTLWRIAGEPDVGVTGTYSDVKTNSWNTKAIEWANASNVFKGYSDGTFKPSDAITRQDFALMVMNTANYIGFQSKPGDPEAWKEVEDYKDVDEYAIPAIQWNYSNQIMGQGSNFNPTSSLRRAEAAAVIQRMIENTSTSSTDNVYNILMMGIDYNNYSDATILVSINRTDKTITFTSVLRDMRLPFKGVGEMKFNNAFRLGGPLMTVAEVEKNFDIKLDAYAFVHFNEMADIFDYIGGLDIEISDEEVENANGYVTEMLKVYNVDHSGLIEKSGKVHLDGYQLVGFCRSRYVGNGDFVRTERQRYVFSTMFEKFKTMSFTELVEFFAKAMPNVTHNLTKTKLAELIGMLPTLLTYKLQLNRVPQEDNCEYDPDTFLININFFAASKFMKKMIYNF